MVEPRKFLQLCEICLNYRHLNLEIFCSTAVRPVATAELYLQDSMFAERVLDVVNLMLVGLVGPDAEVAIAAATVPAQQQVSAVITACCTSLTWHALSNLKQARA